MKRIQLFEIEDFNGLSTSIRVCVTHLIVVFHKMMGSAEVITSIINKAKAKKNFNQIVDMGSGSGGIMPTVINGINEGSDEKINLLLTDLYPNPKFVEDFNSKQDNISYQAESMDATNIGSAPTGLKTMVASFHHMRPEVAKKILKSAEESGEPIMIYELAKNNIPLVLWWVLLPISLPILIIMSLFMTFMVRPFSFNQFLFTYFIPIIPIIYAWDGQASLVRTYTFKDVKELIGDMNNPNYEWEIQDAKKENGKTLGYYILGTPK